MTKITEHLLTNKITRPALRDKKRFQLNEVRGIVLHWTANTSSSAGAEAHYNYFNTTTRPASAHYFIEEDLALKIIPETEVAFHVGDKPRQPDLPLRTRLLEGALYKNPNYYTLGIEMCVNAKSDWTKTVQKTIEVCRDLLDRHGLTVGDLYRHYDLTGKDCPKMFLPIRIGYLEWDWNWEAFKAQVAERPQPQLVEKEVVRTEWKETLKPINEYSFKSLLQGLLTKTFSFSWLKRK